MQRDPQQLRIDTLKERDALTAQQITEYSQMICDRLLALQEIQASNTIFAYVSFRSEVSTFTLIKSLMESGKTVTVPITYVKKKRLDAIEIKDMKTDLIPGYCDIPEPTPQLCKTRVVDPKEINTILLPGSVFDKRGGRFGYGGGFYDRFVSAIPQATRIGLAYDVQVADQLALQAHDELLDYVVTPSTVHRAKR